jgi:hypothetical protein
MMIKGATVREAPTLFQVINQQAGGDVFDRRSPALPTAQFVRQ